MKLASLIVVLILLVVSSESSSQSKTDPYVIGTNYDARLFLSKTQVISFNRVYPEFDSSKAVKNWEWQDVDPLGLFSPEENRARRRNVFLFEYSSNLIDSTEPTSEQLSFKFVVLRRFEGSEILLDKSNIKILVRYTNSYELRLPLRNLLEKLSDLGLQWAQAGGDNLYIYNGNILMGRYKSGYVGLSDLDIDRPFKNSKKVKRTAASN